MGNISVACLSRFAVLAGVAGIGLLLVPQAEAGERVGIAAAVTPQATSRPPGAETRTLKIGKSVVYNEHITTSDTGVVQVLLLDGSTFTVGPGSSLVIDKFVYDPNTGAGELAASLSKGALRFVGGKLSKTEPGVKVKTPAGTLTVRGGIFQGIVQSANQAVFAFVFGHHLSLDRHGHRYILNQTGNLFYIRGSGAPVMRQTTQGDVNIILAAVSGRNIQIGGKIYKIKGQAWPFYYGIQPTGTYPDQPFIRELYYDGAYNARLHRVPDPVLRIPNTNDRTHNVTRNVTRDVTHHVVHEPRPPKPVPTPPVINRPGVTDCANCR